MKKLFKSGIFTVMLLVQFFAVSQTIPPDATQLENIQITNNTTSTTATKMVVQENNGVLNTMSMMSQDNVFIVKNVLYNPTVNNSLSYTAGLVNALPSFVISDVNNVVIVSTQNPTSFTGIQTRPKTYKYILINKGKGTYGTGGTAITENDLELVSVMQIDSGDIETLPSTQVINTGANISGTNISSYVNSLSPAIALQSQSQGYVLFKVLNGTTPQTYLFLDVGGLYGLGQLQTTLSDFQLLESSPTPVVPTLDAVTIQSGNNMTERISQVIGSLPVSGVFGFDTNGQIRALNNITSEGNMRASGGFNGPTISFSFNSANFSNGTPPSPGIPATNANKIIYYSSSEDINVPTTFTGRQIPDANWVNAGLALKANLNTPNNYTGKQTVAGEISSESSAMDNRINFQTTGPHPNIQSANFDDNAGKALALNAFGLGVSINKFYPEYALDVNGITRSDNFITNTATASNHAVPLGQIKTAVKSVTTTTTITLADYGANKELLVLCSASGGAFSVNIPASATILGYKTRVMKTDYSVNAVTADANGSELINQTTTFVLTAQNQVIQLESNSTQLYITN